MQQISKYIIMFFFYSVAGWVVESLYCSIGEKKIINRGFLTGPLCPIYGSGALIMIILLYNPFKEQPLYIFLLGMFFCDILEYVTSFIMEKLFGARWWDYTYEFMNIKGRICLKHSMYWGVASVCFVNLIHPFVDNFYESISGQYISYILVVVLALFTLDIINAVRKAGDIRKLQQQIDSILVKVSTNLVTVKIAIGDKYADIQNNLLKQTDKIYGASSDISEQIQDVFKQFELSSKKTDKQKKNKFYNRLIYNNPRFEKRTRKQLEKLKELRDDIKSNIFEKDEMQ